MKGDERVYIKIYDHIEKDVYLKPICELVKEMVVSHIPISFEIEALKAQSIIARTMIIRQCRHFGGSGCRRHKNADLCTDGHCGTWLNKKELKERWEDDFEKNWNKLDRAQKETENLILTINNKPISPRFHSTCGGATQNSEDVDGNRVIYLRKVLCDYCKKSPHYYDTKEFTLDEIEKRLNIKILEATPTTGLEIESLFEEIQRDKEGRIVKLKIGGKEFKGTDVMKYLGLNSTRFGWQPASFKIKVQGKGDGLGLCQYGANMMAKEEGKKAEKILNYYFTGVQIRKIQKPSDKNPLSGKVIVVDPGHGGDSAEDIVGPEGVREKDINLAIGMKLLSHLKKAGAEAYITRKQDEYISLSRRADFTNNIKPDFFLSIHQNSFSNPHMSGSEIYYSRGDGEGKILAKAILEEMSQSLQTVSRGVKIADFYLLNEIRSSALQIEVAFITNPEEEKNLKRPQFQNKAAASIVNGLIRYYSYE